MMAGLRALFGVQDMTSGSPARCLLRFSIPLLIGNFAQQLYNTVDSMVVGKYIGDVALAAVGTSTPILNLMLVLFMGISTGAGILSAQFFGGRERERLSRLVGSTMLLTLASGVLMCAIGWLAAPFLIGLVAPPPNVAEGAIVYLKIYFLGMVGNAAYNILAGVLRGMGDSVHPLLYLILASLMNIVLDLVFVRELGLGIAGVAWATIIAQAVSGGLCFIRLTRMRDTIDFNKATLRPDMQLVGRVASLGLPAGVTMAIFSMSAILVQNLTNSLGEAMIAANVAVMRVDGFAMMPNFTFGTASTTYVGQNIGAGRYERIKTGTRAMLIIALTAAVVLVTGIYFFGTGLIGMFTNTEMVIELGNRGLRWLMFGYVCFAASQVLQGVMRGCGETVVPMWIGIISTVVLRMPLAYLLAAVTRSGLWPNGHPDAIFSSLLISWVLSMLMTVFMYKKGKWRRKIHGA